MIMIINITVAVTRGLARDVAVATREPQGLRAVLFCSLFVKKPCTWSPYSGHHTIIVIFICVIIHI